ncbi:competence protein ComEA [Silvimonas terrae]|uniref:Competence protein ComEA n=1 Tax=Silvimonas terrae TaxID=300266 RepID=A0A840RHU7_9NEIS|nr:competence protein ComEA [Silvimonas terrae]
MKKWLVALLSLFLIMGSALAAVNINTATLEQLETIKGIGPSKAKAIIDYRTQNGPFKTPEDIMKVAGIKEGTYNKIKGDIAISGATMTPTPVPVGAKAPAGSEKPPTTKPTKPPKTKASS